MNIPVLIVVICAIMVVIATVIAVITVVAPPKGVARADPVPSAAVINNIVDDSADTTPVTYDADASSEITTVVDPDVASYTNPDEEYTIVPVDSVPLEYEVKHLDLTDRSQGQYIPSWRDSINMTAIHSHSNGKLKPIAKQDALCSVTSEREVTRTADFTDTTDGESDASVGAMPYHSSTSVQNFMSNRL